MPPNSFLPLDIPKNPSLNIIHGLGHKDVEKGAMLPAIYDLTVAAWLKIISEVLTRDAGGMAQIYFSAADLFRFP